MIKIVVHINQTIFRNFAFYDTLKMKKQWKSPVIFTAILLVSSLLCFSRYKVAAQATLLGTLLAIVAVGVPVVYFVSFYLSVKKQGEALKLAKMQYAYTIVMKDENTADAITIFPKNGAQIHHAWSDVYGAYQGKNCIYLYLTKNRAFFLPVEDIDGEEEKIAAMFQRHGVKGNAFS